MSRLHVFHPGAAGIRESILARAPGHEVIAITSATELADHLPEIEILFAAVPPRAGWACAHRLRLVHMMGVGVDHFLPSPDLPERVVIGCARGVFAAEASEHAIALLLAVRRGFAACVARQAKREFKQFASPALAESTVAVLGAGAIGARIVKSCAAFDMRVLAVRRSATPVEHAHEVFAPGALDDALSRANHVIVALPRTPETEKVISDRALSLVPRGALLVCIGRGGVVDEDALLRALESGRLGGAGIDVFEKEPLARESPLWSAPNLFITPHNAGVGLRYQERVTELFLENVQRMERGEAPLHVVDRALGY